MLLIIDAVAAAGLLPNAWPKADKRSIAVMGIGGVIGIPLGTLLLAEVSPIAVRWFITIVVMLLLALLSSGWRYRGRPSKHLTIMVGTVSGVFTGAAGTGGPPIVAYWLGRAMPGDMVRANIVAYFAVATVITFASYGVGGLLVWRLLPLSCTAGPLYALGLYAGSRLFAVASDTTFRWISYGLIAGASIMSLPVLDPILR